MSTRVLEGLRARVQTATADGQVQRGERKALHQALTQAILSAQTPDEVDAYVAAVHDGLGFSSWGNARTFDESRDGRAARREAELHKLTLGKGAALQRLATFELSDELKAALTQVVDDVTPSGDTKAAVKDAFLKQLATTSSVEAAGRLWADVAQLLYPYAVPSRFEVLTGLEYRGSWPFDALERATVERQHQLDPRISELGSVVTVVNWP